MVKTITLALTAKVNQPFWFVNHQDIIFQIMWLKCFKTQTRLYFKLKIWIPHQGLKVQPKTPRRLTNSLTFWTTRCRDLQLRAWLLLLYLSPLCNQSVEVWHMVYFFLKVVYRLLLHNLGLIQDKMQYLIKIWHICPAFLRLQPYDQSGNMAILQKQHKMQTKYCTVALSAQETKVLVIHVFQEDSHCPYQPIYEILRIR